MVVKNTDVEIFEEYFVKRRQPFLIKSSEDWYERKGLLTSNHVINHLNEKYWCAAFGNRIMTKKLCFDIDNHNDKTTEVQESYDYLIDCFGITPLVFQSSESGGLHLYYDLEKWFPQDEVNLHIEQIIAKKNNIELRRTKTKSLRLPVGKNSYLLDFNTLLPLSFDKLEQMNEIKLMIENQKIEPLSGEELFQDISIEKGISKVMGNSEFILDMQDLFEHGLYLPSSRNESLLMLNWYFQAIEGKKPHETAPILKRWIAEKHNGMSKDWISSPVGVYKQIDSMVANFDRGKVNFKPKQTNINTADIKYVENLTDDSKYQKFLLRLIELRRTKGEIVAIPKTLFDCWNARELKKKAIEDSYLNKMGGYWHGDNILLNHCQRYNISLDTKQGLSIHLTNRILAEKIALYGLRGLADKIGISRGYIWDLNNGRKSISNLSIILQAKIILA